MLIEQHWNRQIQIPLNISTMSRILLYKHFNIFRFVLRFNLQTRANTTTSCQINFNGNIYNRRSRFHERAWEWFVRKNMARPMGPQKSSYTGSTRIDYWKIWTKTVHFNHISINVFRFIEKKIPKIILKWWFILSAGTIWSQPVHWNL